MIRGLILYYLNIKETHGYEIQRFIQLSGIDQWTKIQSGSIYYALGKLEKEKNITIVAEEGTGQKSRKIYAITEKGRETLRKEMMQELSQPITTIGSTKFITEPILSILEKEEITSIIMHHLEELQKELAFWKQWKNAKVDESDKLMALSFDISVRSLEDQILWHEELLQNLDYYKKQSNHLSHFISQFNSDTLKRSCDITEAVNSLEFVQSLKDNIINHPELAIKDLDRIIEALNQKVN